MGSICGPGPGRKRLFRRTPLLSGPGSFWVAPGSVRAITVWVSCVHRAAGRDRAGNDGRFAWVVQTIELIILSANQGLDRN
jgi:hypothetical protein